MNIKNKCQHCGKSLLSPHQIKLRKYSGGGWDKTTLHYRCWSELKYQNDLETITKGMAKLTLQDTTECGPAAFNSTATSSSWQLLLLLLLSLSLLLSFVLQL